MARTSSASRLGCSSRGGSPPRRGAAHQDQGFKEIDMDHDRFDGLTRSLGGAASRRGFGRALAGGGLGALLGSAFGALDADAKKKGRKKKRRRSTQQGCTPNCTDRTCGNDGCGGSC